VGLAVMRLRALSPRYWLLRRGCRASLKYPSLTSECRWCLSGGSYTVCAETGFSPGCVTSRRTCWRHLGAELIATQQEHPDAAVFAVRHRQPAADSAYPLATQRDYAGHILIPAPGGGPVARRAERPYWAHSDPGERDVPQHPCARGAWCSAATTAPDGETITPALTRRASFCDKCRLQVQRAVGDIPELWVRLHCELGEKGQGGERVTMSRSAPLPLNAGIDALLREHLDILASWDERVRMAAGLVLPDTQAQRARPDHGRMVAEFCRTLTVQLDRLLGLPADAMARSFSLHDLGRIPEGARGRTHLQAGYAEVTVELSGADAGEEILALRHKARSALGETRMTESLDVPCPDPSCEVLMFRVQGSNYAAECRACGRLLSETEYRQWTKLYAATISTADLARLEA
jgi:hypothetical protein